jgi:AbrB family looped-hinge helix DNA binding protein
MGKVTSKYQVTVPKTIADRYHIRPGDEIEWQPAGDVIRVVPANQAVPVSDREMRLHLFDQATARQLRRGSGQKARQPRERGWQREDLYTRGRSR